MQARAFQVARRNTPVAQMPFVSQVPLAWQRKRERICLPIDSHLSKFQKNQFSCQLLFPFKIRFCGGFFRVLEYNPFDVSLARMFHESLTTTTGMVVLPCVLGFRSLQRTIQVCLGTKTLRLPGGTTIYFALAALRSVPQAGSRFRGLVTPIHKTSGLDSPRGVEVDCTRYRKLL